MLVPLGRDGPFSVFVKGFKSYFALFPLGGLILSWPSESRKSVFTFRRASMSASKFSKSIRFDVGSKMSVCYAFY